MIAFPLLRSSLASLALTTACGVVLAQNSTTYPGAESQSPESSPSSAAPGATTGTMGAGSGSTGSTGKNSKSNFF